MKVYVDEMPKECLDCKFYTRTVFNEDGCIMNPCIFCGEGIPSDCELNLLADHDKEVRKQVCDEINASLMKYSGALLNDNGTIKLPCWVIRAKEFEEKLKEIEKGDKE